MIEPRVKGATIVDHVPCRRIPKTVYVLLVGAFVAVANPQQETIAGIGKWNTRSVDPRRNVGAPVSVHRVKTATAGFDPDTLAQELRNTKAIGFFTKLQLKREIEDLIKQLDAFRHGEGDATLAQLHERFQLLLHKIVSLLQDKDPNLARQITTARSSLWQWLSDPKESAKL